MKIKNGTSERGISIKVLLTPDFSPCKINTSCRNRETKIDDPNLKIFSSSTDEFKLVRYWQRGLFFLNVILKHWKSR